MKILEYNQYDRYLSDKKFMEYFNELKVKVSELFPEINPNLELVIDKVYLYYYEGFTLDMLINRLYFEGNIVQFRGSMEL